VSTKRKPQAGTAADAVTVREAERSNSGRTLDVITAEIQQIERRNVFDIGKLLVEANKVCDHGDWLPWLKAEFEWSYETARRYMNAHQLAAKYTRVRNLAVPLRVIYYIAERMDKDIGPIIDALVEATAGGKKMLSVADANLVIATTFKRIEYGDYPKAALDAMAKVDGQPWGEAAIAALRAASPTTTKEAKAIVESFRRAGNEALESLDNSDGDGDGDEVGDDGWRRDPLADCPICEGTGKWKFRLTSECGRAEFGGEPVSGDCPCVQWPGDSRKPEFRARLQAAHEENLAANAAASAAGDDAAADLAAKLRAAEIKIVGLESEVEDLKRENAALRRKLEATMEPAA
jgi:hypothetical protein